MIEIGYKFPHNGAVVLAVEPATNDSIIVLCKEEWGEHNKQYITGRVYVHQLPRPESWESGTYSTTLEEGVEHLRARAGIAAPGYDEAGAERMFALVRSVEKRLAENAEPGVKVSLWNSTTVEGAITVQIDTERGAKVVIALNDGPHLFEGDPEDPRSGYYTIRAAAAAFLHGNDDEVISFKDLADALGVAYGDVEAIVNQDAEAEAAEAAYDPHGGAKHRDYEEN